MSNTAVQEKDLPPLPEIVYVNAPETIGDAVKRILELEMRLEDLSRAVEIATITQQIGMLDSFKREADECLERKIVIQQPDMGEFKVTIVTNEKEDAKT